MAPTNVFCFQYIVRGVLLSDLTKKDDPKVLKYNRNPVKSICENIDLMGFLLYLFIDFHLKIDLWPSSFL